MVGRSTSHRLNRIPAGICPICLSEPVAPRMAKCGHIFCLPCLIRFMNTSSTEEKRRKRPACWRKCPICEDVVILKPELACMFRWPRVPPCSCPGDDVVLRLMMRNANNTLALPKEEVPMSSGPWTMYRHRDANVLDYARIAKGTGEYMEGEFDRRG